MMVPLDAKSAHSKALSPSGRRGGIPGAVGGDNPCPVQVVPIWHMPNYLNNAPTMAVSDGGVRWELEFHLIP